MFNFRKTIIYSYELLVIYFYALIHCNCTLGVKVFMKYTATYNIFWEQLYMIGNMFFFIFDEGVIVIILKRAHVYDIVRIKLKRTVRQLNLPND